MLCTSTHLKCAHAGIFVAFHSTSFKNIYSPAHAYKLKDQKNIKGRYHVIHQKYRDRSRRRL